MKSLNMVYRLDKKASENSEGLILWSNEKSIRT